MLLTNLTLTIHSETEDLNLELRILVLKKLNAWPADHTITVLQHIASEC